MAKRAMEPMELAGSLIGDRLLTSLQKAGMDRLGSLESVAEGELLEEVIEAARRIGRNDYSATPESHVVQLTRSKIDLARRLLDCAAVQWWTDPWNARRQIWVGPEKGGPPENKGKHPAAINKPQTVLWTSSCVAKIGSAWSQLLATGAEGIRRGESWCVEIEPTLPVFEVRSPSDWVRLCSLAPLRNGSGLIEPDWTTVADHLDGVHLTIAGLISIQSAPLPETHGVEKLWGWDTECTAWLNWRVARAVPVEDSVGEPRKKTGFFNIFRMD